MRIQSHKIMLTPITMEDAEDLLYDPIRFQKRKGFFVNYHWPHVALKAILPLYHEALENNDKLLEFGFWIISTTEKRVVGDICFKGFPDMKGNVELGYYICRDDRQKGYATEAIRLLSTWAFQNPQLKSISAFCDYKNLPSQKALINAGFKKICIDGVFVKYMYTKKTV